MYRFPPRLVERLRRANAKLASRFSRMPSADNRTIKNSEKSFRAMEFSPEQSLVRQINLSRNAKQKFVLKKVHHTAANPFTAEEAIHEVAWRLSRYKAHNSMVMKKNKFAVSIVPAQPIGNDLLLMPRIKSPTLLQLFERKLAHEYGETSHTTSRYDADLGKILFIGNHLMNTIPTDNLADIFYLGKNGKGVHQFMLALDNYFFPLEGYHPN
jgi:hypothetical protein